MSQRDEYEDHEQTLKLDQAHGFAKRSTCKHTWQPVSFRFETERFDVEPRTLSVTPSIRQPDTARGRVYCVCMNCASHSYLETRYIGFYLGGDRPVEPEANPRADWPPSERRLRVARRKSATRRR